MDIDNKYSFCTSSGLCYFDNHRNVYSNDGKLIYDHSLSHDRGDLLAPSFWIDGTPYWFDEDGLLSQNTDETVYRVELLPSEQENKTFEGSGASRGEYQAETSEGLHSFQDKPTVDELAQSLSTQLDVDDKRYFYTFGRFYYFDNHNKVYSEGGTLVYNGAFGGEGASNTKFHIDEVPYRFDSGNLLSGDADGVYTLVHTWQSKSDNINHTMTMPEMFHHLTHHGCVDFSSQMNTQQDNSIITNGGGFGDIWSGKLNNGARVAIKTWRSCMIEQCDYKILKRATREIYFWSRLKHENIIPLMGVIIFKGHYLGMVSEWMENGNLNEYMRKNPHCDRHQILGKSIQVASGLTYMHQWDAVHGDLKACNVLVSSDGVPMIGDFGSSTLSEAGLSFSETINIQARSMRWTSPELLVEGTRSNKPSDVYALGMTILEIFTGAVPYPQCRTDFQVMNKLSERSIPTRPDGQFKYDERGNQMWELLVSCWDRKPDCRPTAKQVLEHLIITSPAKVPGRVESSAILPESHRPPEAPLPPTKTQPITAATLSTIGKWHQGFIHSKEIETTDTTHTQRSVPEPMSALEPSSQGRLTPLVWSPTAAANGSPVNSFLSKYCFYASGVLHYFDDLRRVYTGGGTFVCECPFDLMKNDLLTPNFFIDGLPYWFDVDGLLSQDAGGTFARVHSWPISPKVLPMDQFLGQPPVSYIDPTVVVPDSNPESFYGESIPTARPTLNSYTTPKSKAEALSLEVNANIPEQEFQSGGAKPLIWSPIPSTLKSSITSNITSREPSLGPSLFPELRPPVTSNHPIVAKWQQELMKAKESKTTERPAKKPAKEERRRCPECNKLFRRPSSLDDHLNVHSGKKTHICPFERCNAGFATKSNMKRHFTTHRVGVLERYQSGITPQEPQSKSKSKSELKSGGGSCSPGTLIFRPPSPPAPCA